MSRTIVPFSLKDAPALIERLLPVQKLSAEAYKEQMAVHGKTLTALGSYWKGRKPLILNKACILGCLLPATANLAKDLEIFEKLMAMDYEFFLSAAGSDASNRRIYSALFQSPKSPTIFLSSPSAHCRLPRQWIGQIQSTSGSRSHCVAILLNLSAATFRRRCFQKCHSASSSTGRYVRKR